MWVFFGIIPNHYKYYKDPKKNNQGWMESKRVFYFLFSGSLWFSVISQQKPTYFGDECGRVVKLRALFWGIFSPLANLGIHDPKIDRLEIFVQSWVLGVF